ncbi:dehydrogenase [Actinoplanes sp. OR16]|uniref:Gfo/Idh/MocA family protein n=1 Tax=Actinoplanes sp. OR16 TaxID=946334 RepID=UPI000F6ECAD7|nr:Gfo/Idh/MocA family oxidoreductase [Actinoplanes sp. OR16]BBH69766.1 dehydrogenase [Actinoplanes sp. OR16]
MKQLRAAVVGTGFMGAVHSRSIITAGGSLVAVVGSSASRGAEAAATFGASFGTGSLDEALDAGVDVVHVCTPNTSHHSYAKKAIEAGVAVVCEKPLAIASADAEELTALAAARGVVATVPFVYRYYASVREARARLRAPGADTPWLLHGSYLQDWLADPAATNWRVSPAAGGPSRAFADIGVHWCDLLEFVTGQRIVSVSAKFGRSVASRPTEDGAVVAFTTDLGAIGSVVVSQATPGRKNALSFSFDSASASYAFCQETPESLWVGGLSSNEIVLRDPSRTGTRAGLPAGHPQGYYECFADFVADTYAAIRGSAVDGLPSFADGLRANRITAAVIASAASGRWEEIA